MRKLNTIQTRENLNTVYAIDEPSNGNACHEYKIMLNDVLNHPIIFQNGPRHESDSTYGILDTDLLEIVRDRLKGFQSGPYATEYNAIALNHVEEALMWMNRRVEDRIARGVLGTTNK